MASSLRRRPTPTTLLARLIDSPELVQAIRGLPAPAFSALVRRVGLEDAGEVVALASTEQLVTAFDEDLFVNERPGERERFDVRRFATWLEVLLEAGDAVAADRVAELDEDFVVHALSSLMLVFDHEALRMRMYTGGRPADRADKALESALIEEIDGYLLVSMQHEGWDAALALILALDRDHRDLLVRLLDRCATMAAHYVDDLDELATALDDAESLAEDVEAARDERRGRQGFVEPRDARAFLALASDPTSAALDVRDAVTRAHFRGLAASTAPASAPSTEAAALAGLLGEATGSAPLAALAAGSGSGADGPAQDEPLVEALRLLRERDAGCFDQRMAELAYLANVLVAGAENAGRRFRPAEAAQAALLTVALGAEIAAREQHRETRRATSTELCETLGACEADRLFRMASAELGATDRGPGLLRSRAELDAAMARLIEE